MFRFNDYTKITYSNDSNLLTTKTQKSMLLPFSLFMTKDVSLHVTNADL